MLASIHSGSSTKVWPEILRASERHQCQVYAFPGGRLSSSGEFEYMRNSIFGLVSSKSFDGVVCWSSSLSGFVSESLVESFLLGQVDLPLVTFGLKIGDKPVVNIDAYDGMKRLVLHLVRVHGRRKVAFIGGPNAHSSAEDRLRAYRDALAEAGIPCDPRLLRLDTPWQEGGKAILELLDRDGLSPGRDFDALCAASDLLVFEAAKVLKGRGCRIPAEISLGGFNDSDESDLLSPTFTTVRMPFRRQADQAFSMLVELLDGKRPQDRTLRTSLVVRQSCGCVPESVVLAKGPGRPRTAGPAAEGWTASRALLAAARRLGLGKESGSLAALFSGFSAALGGRPEGVFLGPLDAALDEAIAARKDLSAFQDILSLLRSTEQTGCSTGPEGRERLESLVHQGRVLVSGAERRMSNLRVWEERAQDRWLSILNHELLCAKDFRSVVEAAARSLPMLGMSSGYFVLNEEKEGRHSFIGCFETPSQGREAVVQRPASGKLSFPAELLLPEEFRPAKPGAFIVLPLYYESTSLGYAVLESTGGEASVFEEARAQLSSALRGVLLFEQVDQARQRAEKAEKLKTEFLAGVSGELQEPIRFINGMAGRLLAERDLPHRAEIEAIAARSADQLELTKRLLDLSLAQVGDLGMEFALLSPAALARDFSAAAAEKLGKGRWGSLGLPATDPPLLQADRGRILQVLEIFCDILRRELGAGRFSLRLESGKAGISFLIAGEAPSGVPAARLRRMMESRSPPASPEEARIEIELARSIAFLHGGSLGLRAEGPLGPTFLLSLPYPCLDGSIQAERQERGTLAPAWIGGGAAGPAGIFPGPEPVRLGGDLGATRQNPENLAFLYFDPRCFTPEDWTVFRLLAGKQTWRRIPCLVPAELLDPSAGPTADLGALLRRFEPEDSDGAVFFLGGPEDLRDELAALAVDLGSAGLRVFRCEEAEDLVPLAEVARPRLLVLAGQRGDFLLALAHRQLLAETPLLCLSERLVDPAFEGALTARPRTFVCNAGPVFRDLAFSMARTALEGRAFLPAPTALLVSRAVFFLNRHFREQVSRWKLSEQVNASEDYLSRIFHRQMGVPLWDYLNRLRIGRAVELLRGSTDSVAELAARAGFQDQAYFCRVFRRVTGLNPGAFRRERTAEVRKVQ